MSKKILFIILGVIILGGIAFGVNQIFKEKKTTTEEISKPELAPIITPEKIKRSGNVVEEGKWLNEALSVNDPTICKKITDILEQAKCEDEVYSRLAKESLSLDICRKINNDVKKNICFNDLLFALARANRDLSLCDEITAIEQAQECKTLSGSTTGANGCDPNATDPARKCKDIVGSKVAVESLNAEECDKIENVDLKNKCKEDLAKVANVIKGVTTEKNDISDESAAVITSKTINQAISSCTGENKLECESKVYRSFATEQKDASLCEKIKDVVAKEKCESNEGAKINRYWLEKALTEKNKAYCKKIFDLELRGLCESKL